MLKKIEYLMNARLDRHGDLLFYPFSEHDKVYPVFTAYAFGGRTLHQIILHDIFHHAAMDLDYSKASEYWTVLLDREYRWNDAPHESLELELAYFADGFEDEVPDEEEHEEFLELARSRLGDILPKAFYRPIKEAFTAFLSGKHDEFETLADMDYKLVVHLSDKSADGTIVELIPEGKTDLLLLAA